jgi:hypothetical protein
MLQAIQEHATARWFWTDWLGVTLVMAAGGLLAPINVELPHWARWTLGLGLGLVGQFLWRLYG